MTRDSIPRDDLYGELEVSRQASVAAIEAAYRRLVKQHHPDVARSDDIERIKRLNLAREWLTDLDRRRRYDVSRGFSPTSTRSHDDRRAGTPAPRDTQAEATRTFGVNANEVRIFLAGLRGLDTERARRVFDGRAVAHAQGYTAARRLAEQIGHANRRTEWQLAREAASVIARGKLGDTTLTEQVVDVLADAAGAIAIRDLLSKSDYSTLLLPWTWKSARIEPPSAAAGAAPRAMGDRTPKPAAPPAKPLEKESVATPTAAKPVVVEAPPAESPANPAEPAANPAAAPAAAAALAAAAVPVSISDLGVSPWGAGAGPDAATPAVTPASSRLARRSPALSPAGRPVPARPGPERSSREAAVPSRPLHMPRPSAVRIPGWLPAAIGIAVVVVVAGALLGLGRPPAQQAVGGATDAPTFPAGGATAVVAGPGESLDGTTDNPSSTDPAAETAEPGATEPPGGPGGPGGATPRPGPTQPGSTPRPTPAPTPTPAPPTPTPEPTPPPTPTPEPTCVVPNLVGQTYTQATTSWAAAGFTGPVTDDPQMQPNQRIGSQSLAAGSSEPCSSGITVQKVT